MNYWPKNEAQSVRATETDKDTVKRYQNSPTPNDFLKRVKRLQKDGTGPYRRAEEGKH